MSLLDLRKPEDAKKYIDAFEIPGQPKINFVVLSSGRKVDFATMTDEDAILVASLLQGIEIEAERRFAVENGRIQ